MGISAISIEGLLSEGGRALRYFCCSCRFKDGSNTSLKKDGSNDGSFSQLLEMVVASAGQVRDLVDKVITLDTAGLREKQFERATEKQGLAVASNLTQNLLQSEIREFHERRKSSIIIRRCPAKMLKRFNRLLIRCVTKYQLIGYYCRM